MPTRFGPVIVIVLLGLVFFTPLLLQPGAVLFSDYSDFVIYHLPCHYFQVRSWQATGELPLWCPEMFAGMPFVHDAQVSAFYPLHLPLLLVPERHQGAALSWLIVLHVVLAGCYMFAYARHRGLTGVGALTAALGYMFAGKWLMHILVAGHYNMTPLAWLPLILLLSEQAVQRRSLLRATGAGAGFALIVLGTHPQLTFYSGMFIALWTLLAALENVEGWKEGQPLSWDSAKRKLGWWAGLGLWTAVIAVMLAGIQILPALEATRASSRTLGVDLTWSELVQDLQLTVIGLVGPPLITETNWYWENRGGFGIIWLAVAGCAPILVNDRRVRYEVGATLFWMFLGLGGVVLLQWLPGFHLWRIPSRMLILAALPVALLAGTTTQALFAATGPSAAQCATCRSILLKVTCYVLVPLAICAGLMHAKGWILLLSPYWLLLPVTVGMAWLILGSLAPKEPRKADQERKGRDRKKNRDRARGNAEELPNRQANASWLRSPWTWCAVLLADLWLLVVPLVGVHDEADLFTPSACIRYLADRRGEHGRVLDMRPIDPRKPEERAPAVATPLWPNFAMIVGLEPVRGYNPLDVLRYKEFLQFVMDLAEPLRALGSLTSPAFGPFDMENPSLADLLGIRYLLLPTNWPLARFVTDPVALEKNWSRVFVDPNPRTYSFLPSSAKSNDAGLHPLPPYAVYENRGALPRAFVVPNAKPWLNPLPDLPDILEELKTTNFRQWVLLEGWEKPPGTPERPARSAKDALADIVEYQPNRVTIDVNGTAPGWLVLTDIWYPGWTCTVDGQPVPIYRANYLFRAVAVDQGPHRVVFSFAPRSYAIGKMVTLTTLAVLAGCLGLLAGWYAIRKVATRNVLQDSNAENKA